MSDEQPRADRLAGIRKREEIAKIIGALALDIDATASRGARGLKKLEKMDAEPNRIVAMRRAIDSLVEVASALRRDGWLDYDQQRLL